MTSREECISKYMQYKEKHGAVPRVREFYAFSGVTEGQLVRIYGRNAYTKLQKDCGDEPNRLTMERTPRSMIMRQYGDLALELGSLPNTSDWSVRNLRPARAGLEKRPHFIKWRDFPGKFTEWVEKEGVKGYEAVIELIRSNAPRVTPARSSSPEFETLIRHIRQWSPARRRNSEGEYKIELRSHLKALGYRTNEEYGESLFDLLIDNTYSIELKKDPKLGDYDRLFGQLARHLQHQRRAIAVIFDTPSEDTFSNFASLVDAYLNKDKSSVELIKK